MGDTAGYLIEVSDKTEISGDCGIIKNMRKITASPERLAELLDKESGHTVWSARLIDTAEFRKGMEKAEEML